MIQSALPCIKIIPDPKGVYHGAIVSDNMLKDPAESEIYNFEKMSGENLDIASMFVTFGSGLQFPTNSAEAMAAGKRKGVLFIRLVPWDSGRQYDNLLYLKDVTDGKYDDMLRRFAEGAKNFGGPVFVSLGWRMNQDRSPLAGGNAQLYKDAYRHVHSVISSIAGNVTWVFNPFAEYPFEEYYPGDDVVDWVAADSFNEARKKTPEMIFNSALAKLEKYNKPIMVGQYSYGQDSPSYIDQSVQNFTSDKRIKAFVYFNDLMGKSGSYNKTEERYAYSEALRKKNELFLHTIKTIDCGSVPAVAEPKPKLPIRPIFHPYRGQLDTNGGLVLQTGSEFSFAADHAKDPAGVLSLSNELGNADVSGTSTMLFDIKGKKDSRLIVQVYSSTDSDSTPSYVLDPVQVSQDYSTVKVDVKGLTIIKKIQFQLITDNGSCELNIRNVRFE